MEISKFNGQTGRWNHIDFIEFLGILFVLMYHSNTYSYFWMDDGSGLSFLRYYLRTILSTCVPLFFFANGYLLLNRSFNLKKHIVKTLKIIVLTFIWGIINILCCMLIKKEYLTLKEIAEYLWTWHQGWINFLWYMGALVCIYVFFPLIKTVFDNSKKIFIYFTVVCAILTFGNAFMNYCGSVALNITGVHDGILSMNWFNMFNPFRGIYGYTFVYFCLGGLAHGIKDRLEEISPVKRNTAAIAVIILSCLGLFAMGIVLSDISGKMWDVVWKGYDTIFTFINVCMIFTLCLSYRGNYRIVQLVSANTLGIYFMHPILILLSIEYVTVIPIAQSFLGTVVYAFIIMLTGLAITQLFMRIPVIKRLVKL
ncbi:MAG: acyltransferase [Lachnospiraceae bacterium]